MRSTIIETVRIGWACVLTATPSLATTWIVDDNAGPDVDFPHIQAAIDAAVDGDVIEVRPGGYAPFAIDGKALVVRGVGNVRVVAALVTNVDATRSVELSGLQIGLFGGPERTSLTLTHDAGPVRVVDCLIAGKESFASDCTSTNDLPRDAVNVADCQDVTFLRCDLRGGQGETYSYYVECAFQGAAGVRAAAQSRIVLLECQAFAGSGGRSMDGTGGAGGHAAVLVGGSTMLAHESLLRGGAGGNGGCDGACGGPACVVSGPENRCPDGPDGSGVLVLDASHLGFKDSDIDSIVGSAQEVAIAPFCIGTFVECPCNNAGAGVAGCESSSGHGGGRLEGVGNASVSADTVTLQVTGLVPNASPVGVLFQGNIDEVHPFGDGLRCTAGTIVRLEARAAANGAIAYGFGQAGSGSLAALGGLGAGGARRYYQVVYRNAAAGFCTADRFNASNALDIRWGP